MRLQASELDGIAVLAVQGSVGGGDAACLQHEVRCHIDEGARGVVLDLSEAGELAPEAVDVLNWLSRDASGWPRTTLSVCCAPQDLVDLLAPEIQVHPDRCAALQHVDDREPVKVLLDVQLAFDEGAPARARTLVRECAAAHGMDEDDLTLVVSEMVTNAVRYGQAPVRLAVDTCEHCLTVVVEDGGGGRPRVRQAHEDAEGGRGLLLVQLLSHAHGVRSQPPGKAVWAELPLSPA